MDDMLSEENTAEFNIVGTRDVKFGPDNEVDAREVNFCDEEVFKHTIAMLKKAGCFKWMEDEEDEDK